MRRYVAALALLAPLASLGAGSTAELHVSARVIRSVAVSVSGGAGDAALRVRMPSGATWAAPVAGAGTAGVGVTPYPADPRYVVVTILADGPLAAGRGR